MSFLRLGSGATVSEKLNERLEDNERLLKMDPAVSLGILADQTGGLLVDNTNALDRAIDRINDDRRHHYLLSYVSTNPALDGTYRKLEVRVKRRDVEVRSRRGYRATPAGTSAPVLGYETPALTALSATPPPLSFPIAARALRTPMPGRPRLVSVVVAVNGGSLAAARDKDRKTYLAEATILARVVDRDRAEVARTSQQYQFTGDVDKQHASMNQDILFFRTPELARGPQIVEAVVYDGIAEKSAVLRIPVDVPAQESGMLVGDLIVVSRAETFSQDEPGAARHPLAWKGALLYPSFGEPIDRTTQPVLTLALPVVADGGPPEATLELRRGTQSLATLPLPVEAPEADGRLMIVGRLPLAQIPPGAYELRATVTHAGETATRTAAFSVIE